MRMDETRARAAAWVRTGVRTGVIPDVRGAFVTGSGLAVRPGDELAPESDLDLVLVTGGPAPARLGQLGVGAGLVLDVSFLDRGELADPAAVARTFYLAPSFAAGTDAVVLDTDGELARVGDQVRRVYADPDVVRDRWGGVLARMDEQLAAVAAAPSWAAGMLSWVFGTSLATQVLLVAGLRLPTVRLRYRAVRELLVERGAARTYPVLLAQLGAADLTPDDVRAQLARLTPVLDAAGDLGPTARAVALAGTERLVAAGDHAEAAFWLVVSFLRAQLALDAADAELAARHRPVVQASVAVLTGLRTPADLVARTGAVVSARPWLVRAAEGLLEGGPGPGVAGGAR